MSDVSPIGLDHVVLRVSDRERSSRWYEAVLGARVERILPDFGMSQLRIGASLVDLVEGLPGAAETRNMDHFCVELAAFDEAALRAHLEAAGIAPGKVARRYGARGHGPSMYLTDPDGNTVELKGPPDADQTDHAPGAIWPGRETRS
jgi:catechol 2,3-dioxygenase-like lactoylglutathione lyase family enzyme